MDKLNLTNIYRTVHTIMEHFLSSAHRTLTWIDYILGHYKRTNKFQTFEIIDGMYREPNHGGQSISMR